MTAPTTHPDAVALGAYHDGELRGTLRDDVAAHLAACAQCRQQVLGVGAVDDALRALPALEAPDVHAAVTARVARGRRARGRSRPRRRVVAAVAAVLAVIAALLAGYDIIVQAPSGLTPRPAALPPRARPHSAAATAPNAKGSVHDFSAQAGARLAPPVAGSNTAPPQPAHGSSLVAPSAASGRLIVRTGTVTLRVPDVQRAFRDVTALAQREGGYVSDSFDNAAGTASGTTARLTLRIPAAAFQATMDRLAALPHDRVTAQTGSQDITDQYHNLQAQLQALQATRAQLLGLMRKAASIRDAMSVLDRLTAVDAQIDATQGQLMNRANSVMLSTITVTLSPQPRKGVVVAVPRRTGEPWLPGRILADAVAHLLRALQSIATVAIYLAVYLALPTLLAVPVILTRRLRRRTYREA